MKSSIIIYFENRKKELTATFTPEQQKMLDAWERDDAGVDLGGFLEVGSGVSQEAIEELQFLIGAIGEVQFLEAQAKKMMQAEHALGVLRNIFS